MKCERMDIRFLPLVWIIGISILQVRAQPPPDFPDQPQCPQRGLYLTEHNDALINAFVLRIAEAFGRQANRDQFAVLILVPNTLTDILNIQYEPSDANGNPVVNSSNALSPPTPMQYVNYVAARPTEENGVTTHAEALVLRERNRLWYNFRCRFGEPIAAILYTRIIPCSSCTNAIADQFFFPEHTERVSPIRRILLYSTQGMANVREQERRDAIWLENQDNMNLLMFFGITVIHVRCRIPDNQKRRRRSADHRYELETCSAQLTVQDCLYQWLNTDANWRSIIEECNMPQDKATTIFADLVNRVMKECSKKQFQRGCASSFLEEQTGKACAALQYSMLRELDDKLANCLGAEKSLIVSKPLDLNNPNRFTGHLDSYAQLEDYVESYGPCNTPQKMGLLCSVWNPDFISAGHGICKRDHPCGYHGKGYSWCYFDFLDYDQWNYCCIGPCNDNGWCDAGSKSVWCTVGPLQWITSDGSQCLHTSPCGYHAGNTYSPWCYVDSAKNTKNC